MESSKGLVDSSHGWWDPDDEWNMVLDPTSFSGLLLEQERSYNDEDYSEVNVDALLASARNETYANWPLLA